MWFVDGHPDFVDDAHAETGETADMGLAVLTGHGPGVLAASIARPSPEPLVDPSHVVLLGHRGHQPDQPLDGAA